MTLPIIDFVDLYNRTRDALRAGDDASADLALIAESTHTDIDYVTAQMQHSLTSVKASDEVLDEFQTIGYLANLPAGAQPAPSVAKRFELPEEKREEQLGTGVPVDPANLRGLLG